MQIIAIVVSLAITVVAVALFAGAVRKMIGVIRLGQPAANRTDDAAARWANMFKETVGHTRMLQWTWVGIAHWFVFVGFGLLVLHPGHRLRAALRPALRDPAARHTSSSTSGSPSSSPG